MRDQEREEIWAAHQRARFMRPDAARYVRPDAERYLRPGVDRSVLLGRPLGKAGPAALAEEEAAIDRRELQRLRDAHFALRRAFVELKLDLLRRQLARKYGYNPNQPRVPAGDLGAGQWTDAGGLGRVRLAGSGKPPLGRAAAAMLALELGLQAIRKFRADNILRDLFGKDEGAVATTTLGDTPIFGTSSGTSDFEDGDRAIAAEMRDLLVQKHSEIMSQHNVGQIPNNALFHAEATVLLRAARHNGGTLTGKTLEVIVDKQMCYGCDKILPYLGLELGDPTITFVDPKGVRKTMRSGRWIN